MLYEVITVIAENIVNEEDAETLSRRILGLVLEDVMYSYNFV